MGAGTRRRIRSPRVVLMSAVCWWCLPASVPASGITGEGVGRSQRVQPGSGSIQQAIDHAEDGDEIVLAPGLYRERLDLRGKAITLRGEGGATMTVVDGSPVDADDPGGSTILMCSGEGPKTRLVGLSIVGGRGNDVNGIRRGGGLQLEHASPEIVNCLLLNNRSDLGGAVLSVGGTPTFRGCWFYGNESLRGGTSVVCADSRPRFLSCGFHGEGVEWVETEAVTIAPECDEAGACCLADVCVMASNLACLDAGGRWWGDGVGCHDSPCPPPCPGDGNTDGRVNVTDLLQILDAWGMCPTTRAGFSPSFGG